MFKEVSLDKLNLNPFKVMRDDWFLITAGTKDSYNTMTASWGGVGRCFNKNMMTIYVRKSRYTHEFLENNDYFTISFFDEIYHHGLEICGNLSGRASNKVKVAGFTTDFKEKAPYFEEAKVVFICKKVLTHDITNSDFNDKNIENSVYGEEKDKHPEI